MGKMVDLTGQKFGRWTVKERDTAQNKSYWICECECGTIRSVSGSLLKNGGSQSCGCLQRELARKRRMIDLTGRKFGRWTVKERDTERNKKNKYHHSYWICECECGTIGSVSSDTLKNGGSKSCGCLKREITSEKTIDLTGRKFGRWTVKERDTARNNENKNRNYVPYWICECECGTIRSVPGGRLKNGGSKSCGCLQRELSGKKMVDLTGCKFGRWTVKELDAARNNENKHRNYIIYWICECECGTIRSVQGDRLKNGSSQSCGCLQRELSGKKMVDLTGCKFGRWTVKELDAARNNENKSSDLYWICECACGTIRSVSGYTLKNGGSKSCGCLRRDLKKQRDIGNGKSLKKQQNLHKKLGAYLCDETNIAEKIPSDNTFSAFGVSYDTTNNKWVASITVREKVYYKAYKSFSGAIKWRQKMEGLLFEPVIAEFNESRMMEP